jgi:uncharacterized membrane protein
MEAKIGRREKPRIESLSDLIFGLALSLGSLILVNNIPKTQGELVVDIAQFSFSFFILIVIWSIYTRIAGYIRTESDTLLILNFVLLFLVAIEPFLYYVLVTGNSYEDFASSVYGLSVGLMYFVLAAMVTVVTSDLKRGGFEISEYEIAALRNRRSVQIVVGLFFVLSSLPIFWIRTSFAGYFRLDMWIAGFFSLVAFRLVHKVKSK